MKQFIFDSYSFDAKTSTAEFNYRFDNELHFSEKTIFPTSAESFDAELLDAALRHAFLILGITYFRSYPDVEIVIQPFELSQKQADYFNSIYRNGLGEFWFVNNLSPDVFKGFSAGSSDPDAPRPYGGDGILLLSTGGKDSLLSSLLLQKAKKSFTPIFLSRDNYYPLMLDKITGQPPLLLDRRIDWAQRREIAAGGGLIGHVPFSAMIASLFLIAAVLNNKNIVVASNESSANEGNAKIGDFVANHAWSKSYEYELMLQDYIHAFMSPDLQYVSLLRAYTDLYISEQFVALGWEKYGHLFASCNRANYKQGAQTQELKWCAECDKCANSWLTLAPFLPPSELIHLFGRNLIKDPAMKQNFLDLLGLGEHKPFECVGTEEELRVAYHMASGKYTEYVFDGVDVPRADDYDYKHLDEQQPLAVELLK